MADNGTYIRYIDKTMSEDKLNMLRAADEIIKNYEAQGLVLSLRQIYYQFVSKNLLPNTDRNYHWLGDLISDGRMMGLISWTAIEDRNRSLMGINTMDNPGQAVRAAMRSYRIDMWEGQQWRPEVWYEKDALTGVIGPICNELRVDFFACKGYNSQSAQWRAGQRFADYIRRGQRPIVFHLGDHDPSGIDMTRDNRDRLSMFAGTPILVQRLALNMNQIEQYDPPPNPAKLSDSRAGDYISQYGDSCWELDALEPTVIRDLIRDAVLMVRDEGIWSDRAEVEATDMATMERIADGHGTGEAGDEGDDSIDDLD